MSGVTLPVTRPVGRAMLIAASPTRAHPLKILLNLGYQCTEMDDPYGAMAELCRRPLAYQSVVIGLGSFYREELPLIGAVKRRFPHVEVWLSGVDGRTAALAEAMRLGADGLLGEEGLHRTAVTAAAPSPASSAPPALHPAATPELSPSMPEPDPASPHESEAEPVLSAEELRALLRG